MVLLRCWPLSHKPSEEGIIFHHNEPEGLFAVVSLVGSAELCIHTLCELSVAVVHNLLHHVRWEGKQNENSRMSVLCSVEILCPYKVISSATN